MSNLFQNGKLYIIHRLILSRHNFVISSLFYTHTMPLAVTEILFAAFCLSVLILTSSSISMFIKCFEKWKTIKVAKTECKADSYAEKPNVLSSKFMNFYCIDYGYSC